VIVSTFSQWTEAKQNELCKELTGYWAENIWDLRSCPVNLPVANLGKCRFLKFECPSQNVNNELKYVCRKKFIQGVWKVGKDKQNLVHSLVDWMKSCLPASTRSLLERDLNDWERSYCEFRLGQSRVVDKKHIFLLASQQFKECTRVNEAISFLRHLYREVEKLYDTRPEHEKDIWDFRQLGVSVSAANSHFRANFTLIQQPWLRQLAKTCLYYRLAIYSVSDCLCKLNALKAFSSFLAEYYPNVGPQHVTRKLMVGYFGFLLSKKLSPATRGDYIVHLRAILELSVRMGWGDLPKSQVIYDEDIPRASNPVPRFIPDQVLAQIFLHLENLETRWQRMFRVAYEVGMRISELINLPFNCLLQDSTGDWWIKYHQVKLKQEHTQPISKETAVLIQTQQQEIQKRFDHPPKLLFPNPKGNRISGDLFRVAINRFIVEHNIRDGAGALWRFQPHQLRHSFGTRHINSGTPHLIVMRLMGHRSEGMTARYAYIHDQTLKQEFEKSLSNRKLIDISGRARTEHSPADAIELQWLKKHTNARTLPNGYCGRPILLEECPTPNCCLTCPHFLTDKTHLSIHENQLAETVKLVQITRSKGWTVQAENNERVAQNLKTIIASLKEDTKEVSNDTQT